MRLLALTTGLTITIVTACAAQDTGIRMGTDVDEAVSTITPGDIIRRIGILADDSMKGRDTPSPELNEVAAWIGGEFRSFGLKPGGDDGDFIQHYPIIRSRLDLARSAVTVPGSPAWKIGTDVARFAGETDAHGVTAPLTVITGRPNNVAYGVLLALPPGR